METREIIIANTRTQKRTKLNTSASTLGELKEAMTAAGIDYSGLTFTEGISKTQLLDDDTQLPRNVMYKGQSTNNLVILLTNTKKNIASGILSRKDAYRIIKAKSLQKAVLDKFGRNFTQVPTCDLAAFISSYIGKDSINTVAAPSESSASTGDEFKPSGHTYTQQEPSDNTILEIQKLIHNLNTLIDTVLKKQNPPVSTSDGSINDDDIDSMIDELNL